MEKAAMISIDPERCEGCGICGEVCPRHVPEIVKQSGKKIAVVVEERAGVCMNCGHCAAVCPNQAISVEGMEQGSFGAPSPVQLGYDDLIGLMVRRRSVRRYKNKPVPRTELDRLIEAVRLAPTGTGGSSTGVIIIDQPEKLKAVSKQIHKVYEALDKALSNPIGRFMVRRRAGEQNYNTLRNFVMPAYRWYGEWYRAGKSDEITRDCPVLMLFHSPVLEPQCGENCVIAAIYCVYAAETMGLGSCFNSLIPKACNRSGALRDMLKLPDDREVHTSVTIGYPKYKFARTIPRRLAEARYL
jgi:nitroreductase/NAD-dependent dihydropyrimidine dehydrogenase PreA subunit